MAVRINAADTYLDRTTNRPPIGSFTIMGWFMIVTDTNALVTVFGLGSNTTGALYAVGTAADGTTFRLWNGTTQVTGTALAVGQWYHAALVVEGTGAGQAKAYLDGALDITGDGNAALTNAKLWIGADAAFSQFNGRVAAVKVWDTALTLAEVRQERYTIRPQRYADINSWFPMFPGAVERYMDYSGLGRNLTDNGSQTDEYPPPLSWGAAAWVEPYTPVVLGTPPVMPLVAGALYSH